jgi:hypothetical protein
MYLTAERYGTFITNPDDTIYPTPCETENDLIALIATLLFDCTVASYRTPEFSVTLEKDVSRPMQIKRLIAQFKKSYGKIKYIDLDRDLEIDEEHDY